MWCRFRYSKTRSTVAPQSAYLDSLLCQRRRPPSLFPVYARRNKVSGRNGCLRLLQSPVQQSCRLSLDLSLSPSVRSFATLRHFRPLSSFSGTGRARPGEPLKDGRAQAQTSFDRKTGWCESYRNTNDPMSVPGGGLAKLKDIEQVSLGGRMHPSSWSASWSRDEADAELAGTSHQLDPHRGSSPHSCQGYWDRIHRSIPCKAPTPT